MAALGGLIALSALGRAPEAYQDARKKQIQIDEGQSDALSQAAMGNALRLFSSQPGAVPSIPSPQPPPPPQPQPQPGMSPQQMGSPGPQGGQPGPPPPPPGMGGPGGMPGSPAPPQGWPQPRGNPMQQQQQGPVGGLPGFGQLPRFGPPQPGQGAPPNMPPMGQQGGMRAMGPPPGMPPQQPGMGGGAPPGAGPGPSGAGGMQESPQIQQARAQGANIPPGGFDWRQMIKAVFDANPGIDPRTAAKAVNNMLPFMQMQSKQEWLMAHNQFLERQLAERGREADNRNFMTGRGQDIGLEKARETNDAKIAAAVRNGDTKLAIELAREDAAQTRVETQQAGAADRQATGIEARAAEGAKTRDWKSGESDKRLAAQLERLNVGIAGKQALGQMNNEAKAEMLERTIQGKMALADMSANLKSELQRVKFEETEKIVDKKIAATAAEGAANRGSREGIAADNRGAAADRQATGIEAKGIEGDKNRATTERGQDLRAGVAATRATAAGQKAVSSISDEELDGIAKRIAEYKQAPYSGGGRGIGAAVMARVGKFNPEYDAREWSKTSAGVKAFGTGKQGDTVRAIGTAYRHMATLAELGKALDNGEAVPLNRLFQTIAAATGSEAPTNFDAAKQIVVAEVIKGIVASGGGVKERQAAEERVSRAASPEQLLGLINHVYAPLLEGQLEGYRQQYKTSTQKDDFDEKFMPKGASGGKGPEPGTVKGGYRFKGGDPSKQENWEKV